MDGGVEDWGGEIELEVGALPRRCVLVRGYTRGKTNNRTRNRDRLPKHCGIALPDRYVLVQRLNAGILLDTMTSTRYRTWRHRSCRACLNARYSILDKHHCIDLRNASCGLSYCTLPSGMLPRVYASVGFVLLSKLSSSLSLSRRS